VGEEEVQVVAQKEKCRQGHGGRRHSRHADSKVKLRSCRLVQLLLLAPAIHPPNPTPREQSLRPCAESGLETGYEMGSFFA